MININKRETSLLITVGFVVILILLGYAAVTSAQSSDNQKISYQELQAVILGATDSITHDSGVGYHEDKDKLNYLKKQEIEDTGKLDNTLPRALSEKGSPLKTQSSGHITFYETEPNNFHYQANLVDGNYTGQHYQLYGSITNYYFDVDYYRFDVKTKGTFTIMGAWVGSYKGYGWEDDLAICIMDENDNMLGVSQLIGSWPSVMQRLVFSVYPGTYYIVVLQTSSFQYLYVNEWYGIDVQFAPDTQYTPVSSVSLNKSSISLTQGDTETLTATVSPLDASNKTVTWSSSNNTVATVSANGMVTAVNPGTATITVTTVDGNKKASCTVTVTAPPAQFTLTVNKFGQGTTIPAVGTHYYNPETQVTLNAAPASDWQFNKWVINGEEITDVSAQIMMTEDKTADAYFKYTHDKVIWPEELDNMMIIGSIGVSIDLLFGNNQVAREKINEALDVEGVSFSDVLVCFARAEQLFWLVGRQTPITDELAWILDRMTGYWDEDGNWVQWVEPEPPASQVGSIYGYIKMYDTNGQPDASAEVLVTVEAQNGQGYTAIVETFGDDGSYEYKYVLEDLTPDEYTLVAKADGYESSEVHIVTVTEGEQVSEVNFKLEKADVTI